MGKSLGNVLDPVALVGSYGSDAVRFYFMKETVFGQVRCTEGSGCGSKNVKRKEIAGVGIRAGTEGSRCGLWRSCCLPTTIRI